MFISRKKLDSSAFRAFYVVADLKNKKLDFTTDTTYKRRFTPAQFFEKNHHPLIVVNGTFFSFETNGNLNMVVKDGKLVACNYQTTPGRGKDTFRFHHTFPSAIGISKKRKADVAWTLTDSVSGLSYATQRPRYFYTDSIAGTPFDELVSQVEVLGHTGESRPAFKKWKMKTAIGGGPVLLQNGGIKVANEDERKFTGKAINDKHPRTAMGYTKDNQLIILVVEGRNPKAGGATLTQEAQILKDLGCVEALNLDGGGSSCLLINGKETIKPSDKEGQRPVPAVFIIREK